MPDTSGQGTADVRAVLIDAELPGEFHEDDDGGYIVDRDNEQAADAALEALSAAGLQVVREDEVSQDGSAPGCSAGAGAGPAVIDAPNPLGGSTLWSVVEYYADESNYNDDGAPVYLNCSPPPEWVGEDYDARTELDEGKLARQTLADYRGTLLRRIAGGASSPPVDERVTLARAIDPDDKANPGEWWVLTPEHGDYFARSDRYEVHTVRVPSGRDEGRAIDPLPEDVPRDEFRVVTTFNDFEHFDGGAYRMETLRGHKNVSLTYDTLIGAQVSAESMRRCHPEDSKVTIQRQVIEKRQVTDWTVVVIPASPVQGQDGGTNDG